MTSFYVYYRVDPAREVELRAAVERLFDAAARECAVRGRLLRRRDDPGTWMEVYEGVDDDARFEVLIRREAAALGLDVLAGPGSVRRLEIFAPVQD